MLFFSKEKNTLFFKSNVVNEIIDWKIKYVEKWRVWNSGQEENATWKERASMDIFHSLEGYM